MSNFFLEYIYQGKNEEEIKAFAIIDSVKKKWYPVQYEYIKHTLYANAYNIHNTYVVHMAHDFSVNFSSHHDCYNQQNYKFENRMSTFDSIAIVAAMN